MSCIYTWKITVLHRIDNRTETGIKVGTRLEAMKYAEKVLGMKSWDGLSMKIID